MEIKTLADLDYAGRRVLVRVDFNVPQQADGSVADATRIREALPTIRKLVAANCRVLLVSHLGRPSGIQPELSLAPVAAKLAELLGQEVRLAPAEFEQAAEFAASLQPGEVGLLENIRFYPAEEKNDPTFAAQLAGLADVFVQEAFGCVHRAHASVAGVARLLPAAAGLLVEKEIAGLSCAFDRPVRPLILVLGGAKIETKIGVLRRFAPLADTILLGGGLANTFLAAEGFEIGASLYEPDKIETAQQIVMEAGEAKVVLPQDFICADAEAEPGDATPSLDIRADAVPHETKILDIGRLTAADFAERIRAAGTVVWNGPLGLAEFAPFQSGTRAVAEALAESRGTSILGGGDTLEILARLGIATEAFSHVSTGGGAMLDFLASGLELPGLAVLRRA